MDELDVECPRCGAKPGVQCHSTSGTLVSPPHVVRQKAANQVDIERVLAEAEKEERKNAKRMRKSIPKYRHKVVIDSYIWCDWHGDIHRAEVDYYDEGSSGPGPACSPLSWRRVYVASDNKRETF